MSALRIVCMVSMVVATQAPLPSVLFQQLVFLVAYLELARSPAPRIDILPAAPIRLSRSAMNGYSFTVPEPKWLILDAHSRLLQSQFQVHIWWIEHHYIVHALILNFVQRNTLNSRYTSGIHNRSICSILSHSHHSSSPNPSTDKTFPTNFSLRGKIGCVIGVSGVVALALWR